jgi:hypothetical protein
MEAKNFENIKKFLEEHNLKYTPVSGDIRVRILEKTNQLISGAYACVSLLFLRYRKKKRIRNQVISLMLIFE